MHDTNRNFFYIVHEVKMKTVFVLTNESGDLNRMINNVYETLGVFLTYDEAVDAMNKEEYCGKIRFLICTMQNARD